jgi:hypothetical protein
MEEPDVPLEDVHEHIQHHAAGHGSGHGNGHAAGPGRLGAERWTMGVALSTALFAALAAIASLIAGGQANEAMISQIESSDLWNYYQAKSIKSNMLDSKMELLQALGHEASAKDLAKHKEYEASKEEQKAEAKAKETDAHEQLKNHETMATAVTMFQVAIALGAIAVLTKLRLFWFISMGLGVLGAWSFASGLIAIANGRHPTTQPEEQKTGIVTPAHGDAHPHDTHDTDAPSHVLPPADASTAPGSAQPPPSPH